MLDPTTRTLTSWRGWAPPSWPRAGRTFWLALVGSASIHAVVYWITPAFVESFTPGKVAHYDANLVPIKQLNPTTPESANTTRGGRMTSRSPPSSGPQQRPPARSEATFAVPTSEAITEAGASATDNSPSSSASTERTPARPSESTATVSDESTTKTNATVEAIPAPAAPRRPPVFAERIAIEYKLSTAITDGVASFSWTRRGAEYEIESSIQATGFLVGVFAGVIHQQSRGTITEEGLRPQQFSIRRGDGEAEIAEFRRDTNALSLKRSGGVRTLPLARALQDMQSFLFQLAYEAPQLADDGGQLDVLVTNARKVYRYQFRKVGTETLETAFGAVETIRMVSEATNPEDQYEVWLASGYSYLPIKLKYYLGRFQVEQLATRVGISGAAGVR